MAIERNDHTRRWLHIICFTILKCVVCGRDRTTRYCRDEYLRLFTKCAYWLSSANSRRREPKARQVQHCLGARAVLLPEITGRLGLDCRFVLGERAASPLSVDCSVQMMAGLQRLARRPSKASVSPFVWLPTIAPYQQKG